MAQRSNAAFKGYSTRRLWCALVALALVLSLASTVDAAGDPDLDWWTIETAHFRVHYPRRLERVARRLARLNEAIFERLQGPLGYTPTQTTEVVLNDDSDSANGSATAIPFNTVRLYVTAPSDLSPLGDYDDWYLGLMTHEYTHILHVDNISGVPSVVNAIVGKTLAPNQFQPRWIIEGLATVEESAHTSGGRIRSSLFDMYIRADVLEDNVVRLDQLSSEARRWPQGTLYYLYGSRFLNWIAALYGHDVLRAVSLDYGASLIPWGINRAIRRQTGRTYVELWDGFVADLRRNYASQMRAVRSRGLREGKRVTFHGRDAAYPQFVPTSGGYQLLYTRDDFNDVKGIYRLPVAGEDAGHETLVARTNATSPVAVDTNGDMIFASVVPHRRVYRRHDLFRLGAGDVSKVGFESSLKRLSVGLRASDPALSPDGRQLAFVINHRGTRTLMLARIDDEGGMDKPRTLVPSQQFDQAYTPTFSPDGRTLAYSAWTAGGYRDVRLVDVKTGKVTQVTRDRALDQNPTFSPDGKTLYFTSDRSGIFNIYALDLESQQLRQVTNVRTGAFMPTLSPDGRLLGYVGYTKDGYDLYVMRLDPARFLDATPAPSDRPAPPPEPPPVRMTRHRYNPLPTLRPYSYFFEYAQGNFGGNALSITVNSADVVGNHAISARLVADTNAPLPMLSLDYRYLRLPFDMSLSLSNRVTPRRDFRFNDQVVEYLENSYNVRSGISYRDLGQFGDQSVGLSFTTSVLDSTLPLDQSGALDPYASPSIEPLRGLINVVRASYNVSNTDGAFDAAGPARGFGLSLALDVADDFIGSEESLYQGTYRAVGYVAMPWPGNHTLALRTGGGLAGGTFARRGVFFVGGLNLENTSLFDQLSNGVFNGAFVLRGYEPGSSSGRAYLLQNIEYRIPLAEIDRGISTLPVYLRRIDGNLFLDYGGAFNQLRYDRIKLFHDGALIDSPDMHTSVGAEIWLGATAAYVANFNMRLGYAFGLSADHIPGGQGYFIASSAF